MAAFRRRSGSQEGSTAKPLYGRRVAEGPGIGLEKALALPPLPGKPAPYKGRERVTYTDGRPEEPSPHRSAAE